MAKFRIINTKFWDDDYVAGLSTSEKLLFLYFFTNTLTTVAGAYEIRMNRMSFDTGIKEEEISEMLAKFTKDGKVFYEGGWIFVVNFAKNQRMNPNMIIGVKNELENLPPEIKPKIEKRFKECGFFDEKEKVEEKKPAVIKLLDAINHKNLVPLFKSFLNDRRKKSANTEESVRLLVEIVNTMSESQAEKAIKKSIASGWTGIFPEKAEEKKSYDPLDGHNGYGVRN